MRTFTMICRDCKHVSACKSAFGKYWEEKSYGGVGCTMPFVPSEDPQARPKVRAEIRQGGLPL